MEKAVEERFERIEAILLTLAIGLSKNTELLGGVTQSLNAFIDETRAYAADSRVRMARMEENLDHLIRAITSEHSNGKKKQ